MGKTKKISRGQGRPKYDDAFYLMILKEHETFSLTELMKYHRASKSTVARWIAEGRRILDEQAKS